jgi:hypothetical protein
MSAFAATLAMTPPPPFSLIAFHCHTIRHAARLLPMISMIRRAITPAAGGADACRVVDVTPGADVDVFHAPTRAFVSGDVNVA